MATDKKNYVYRLMKAECNCGSKDFQQYLNLPKDHGVIFQDNEQPLMNANDHVANEHILSFGRCKSPTNPGDNLGAMLVLSSIPLFGQLGKKLVGVKCNPMTIVPWINCDEDYYIDGAPALTIESELPCYFGGKIKIVAQKVEADDEEETASQEESAESKAEERRDATQQLPSEVQEKIDSFCG